MRFLKSHSTASMEHIPNTSPPEWLLKIFRWFCNPDFVEDIEGDLNERFVQWVELWGLNKAKRNFALEILLLFRPGIIRPIKLFSNIIHPIMLKQNFKIGFRNLIKNKTYSFIKIGGFAIGIATFLLISLFVVDELSVDQHYSDQDRIFRLLNVTTNPDFKFKKWTNFAAPIKEALKEDYAEIDEVGRIIIRDWFLAGDNQIRSTDKKQNNYEEGFVYADPELLDILEIPMLYGTRAEALAMPKSIVLSKKKAAQYFPGENPVGKTVILNENEDQVYTIGGVMDQLPPTSFTHDFLITLNEVEFWGNEQSDWCCNNYEVYLRVLPGTNVKKLEDKLIGIRDDYLIP
ncbi:MAG: ABC transporter permease, partial [Bacteroidota bacterium]